MKRKIPFVILSLFIGFFLALMALMLTLDLAKQTSRGFQFFPEAMSQELRKLDLSADQRPGYFQSLRESGQWSTGTAASGTAPTGTGPTGTFETGTASTGTFETGTVPTGEYNIETGWLPGTAMTGTPGDWQSSSVATSTYSIPPRVYWGSTRDSIEAMMDAIMRQREVKGSPGPPIPPGPSEPSGPSLP